MNARFVSACALAILTASCADKGLSPTAVQFNPKIALQVTITADQQAGFGPRFLIAAAGFDGEGEDDGGFLGAKVIPYAPGTHTLSVPVDLAPCLAYFARLGRAACKLLIGAAIVADTGFVNDTTGDGDPFNEAFDFFFAGPFSIGAGGTLPTVPPIDLSASRFAVVKWEGDEALRLGGNNVPWAITGPVSGVPTSNGVALFAPTVGPDWSLIGSFQGGGAFAQLAIFENGAWRRVVAKSIPLSGPGALFTGVAALSLSEVYLAQQSGLFVYNGTDIARVTAVSDPLASVHAVTAGGAKYVVAGTQNGGVWIGNTQSWQRYSLQTSAKIDGVCITGANEAFAASSSSGQLFRFDGTTWTSVPSSFSAPKADLQCPAPGKAFVIAAGQAMLEWNGSGWAAMPTTGLGPGRFIDWAVVSRNEIYGVADSARTNRAFYRFDGTRWTEVGRTSFTQPFDNGPRFGDPWADPRGGAAYVVSLFGRVEKMTPSGVSVTSYQPNLRDVAFPSATSGFAVGWNMFLARWDGAKWTVDPPPAGTRTARVLQGVWSGGPGGAWAVGSAATILRYTGSGWTVVSDSVKPAATPDDYNAVWGSGSEVWVAGNATVAKCSAGGACAAQATGASTPLYGIWGSSASNIFAVGLGGRIVRYNGTQWTAMASPTTRALVRVTGSGTDNVWAVGDSVVLRFNGTQWAMVPDTGELRYALSHVPTPTEMSPTSTRSDYLGLFQLGLWVRSPNEVYLGSDWGGIFRWDGREWIHVGQRKQRRRVTAISGLPSGCAVAVTDAQRDLPGSQLWRGLGPTGCLASPMGVPATWP